MPIAPTVNTANSASSVEQGGVRRVRRIHVHERMLGTAGVVAASAARRRGFAERHHAVGRGRHANAMPAITSRA